MEKSTKLLQTIALVLLIVLSVVMITSLILLNVEEKMKYVGKGDEISLFGMGEFVLSEMQVSSDDVVANPEGETPDLHMDAMLNARDWEVRKQAGLTNASILTAMKSFPNRYAYSILTPEQQQLYAEMYLVLANYQSNVPLCSNSLSEIKFIAECIYADSPELFYHSGYEYISCKDGSDVVKVNFSPVYSMSQTDVSVMQGHINNYVANCLAGIDTGADAYTKVKYLFEYLIINTEYDETVEFNQTICSVAISGRTVCLGYARMMQYLLQELDIEAAVVLGHTNDGVSHAWNLIKLGNAYYYVDPTWGDRSYRTSEDTQAQSMINYEYLCITSDELAATHTATTIVPLPRCVFQQDNYYVREGKYITSIEPQQFAMAFSTSSYGIMSIKCQNRQVYDAVRKYLIDEGNLYQYINSQDGVQYAENPDMYTYTFFL